MADVQTVTSENGDVHIGIDADGTFVPFAHVPAGRIEQLKERAESLRELAESGDAEAVKRHDEAVAGLPYDASGKSKSKSNQSGKEG